MIESVATVTGVLAIATLGTYYKVRKIYGDSAEERGTE